MIGFGWPSSNIAWILRFRAFSVSSDPLHARTDGAALQSRLHAHVRLSCSVHSPLSAFIRSAYRRRRRSNLTFQMSKTVVELFYDVVSPYSWLGFEVATRYRKIWDLDL